MALTYLQWQAELFEAFQKVAQTVTAENDFEIIASEITKGIREGLKHGLEEEDVFPLLYVAKRPIDRSYKKSQEDFENIWRDTYQGRQEPEDKTEKDLWKTENDLGKIPIRFNGLGSKIIDKWAEKVGGEQYSENIEARDNFIVCLDVDNPDSESGSRSAFYNDIRTTGCLLLTFRNKVYGLLYIHCKKRHFFTEVELRALNAFGTQAAIAIKNAGLTGESYEKLFGGEVLDLLTHSTQVECFDKIGEILRTWADTARYTRGDSIADITIDTIKELSEKFFDLPKEFTEFIEQYRVQEGAFQSIINYREHFVHVFHVFCLGYIVLCQWRRRGKDWGLLDSIATYGSIAPLKTWFIASIYHDVGYPSEKLEILVRNFFKITVGREIRSQFDWGPVLLADKNLEHIKELSHLFAEKVNDEKAAENFEKWFLERLLEDHDHGVLTALILLQEEKGKNKVGWEGRGSDWDLVKEAALAIALHNYWKKSPDERRKGFDLGSLPVEDLGLAFFLTYCDTAQEWGRTALIELTKAESAEMIMSSMRKTDSILENIEVNDNKTVITIRYSAGGEDSDKKEKISEDEFKEYNKRFRSAWYFKNESSMKLEIETKYYRTDNIGPENR